MGKIIDVSHHQGKIDWSKVAKEVDFAIIRVQYGSSTEDREHKRNEQEAKKYGVKFWEYAYGHFTSVEDAIVEANNLLERCDKDTKGLILDVEDLTLQSCGSDHIAEASQAFLDTLKKAGYKTGFYVSHNLYKKFGLDKVKADFLWLPRYGKNTGEPDMKPDYPCDLWQYTSVGRVNGIEGNVDLSKLNGDKDLEWFIGEGKEKIDVTNDDKNKSDKQKQENKTKYTYKIQKGDTFWDLEEKHKWEHGILQKLNPKVNPAKLQVGQEIYIPEKLSSQPKKSEPKKQTEPITHYIIKAGDTFWDLENKFGLPHGTLQKINPHVNPNKLHPGQTINVFTQEKKTTVKKENHYTIKAGDTFWDLEEKHGWAHGTLQKLNPKVDPNRLHVGQKIIIP